MSLLRRGATILEIVISLTIVVIIAAIILVSLIGRESEVQIDSTARQMAALLREAQSRSLSQASNTTWGVHFENSTNTAPFYALYATAYTATSAIGRYPLPQVVTFSTSSIAQGSSVEVYFNRITGSASASTSITIYMITKSTRSVTISVASSGAIRY